MEKSPMVSSKARTNKLVKLGLLAAISVVLVLFVKFPIFPAAPFLEYDLADVPILIGTFMFGPIEGLLITVVVSILQWLLVSPASGWVGAVMHICATGAFVMVAGLIYKKKRTIGGAILALAAGALTMCIAMVPMNIFISPFYILLFGIKETYPEAQSYYISEYIWYSVAFNFIKAGINAVITFLLYKATAKLFNLIDFKKKHPKA